MCQLALACTEVSFCLDEEIVMLRQREATLCFKSYQYDHIHNPTGSIFHQESLSAQRGIQSLCSTMFFP